MKFTHLIEINDPLNPLIDPLTRMQLWRGLVLRAEAPGMFVPHLDRCTLGERGENTLARELQYGELVIRDLVEYLPQQEVRYQVPAQGEIPPSSLVMTIEEPETEVFFVRFSYDDGQPEVSGSEQAYYDQFRRSAYQEADIDTIRIIRDLAGEGRFDLPLS